MISTQFTTHLACKQKIEKIEKKSTQHRPHNRPTIGRKIGPARREGAGSVGGVGGVAGVRAGRWRECGGRPQRRSRAGRRRRRGAAKSPEAIHSEAKPRGHAGAGGSKGSYSLKRKELPLWNARYLRV